MAQPFRLDGKTAFVTGGASGIGEQITRVFSEAGARVVIADLDQQLALNVAASLPHCQAVRTDITDEHSVKAAIEQAGEIDILVNNAGIGMVGNIEETELADLQRLFRVNVEGMFLVTKYALPRLLERQGAIINLGSVAGMVGVRRRFAYCATKGAVIAMTKQLAVDYPTQLRVNCICPGTTDTPFVEAYLEKYHKHEKEEVRQQLQQRQPIGRLVHPREVANLALYLASAEAAVVNGAAFPIDGGWTAA